MKKGDIYKNWMTGENIRVTNVDKELKIVEYEKSKPFSLFDEKERLIRTVKSGSKPVKIFKKIYVKQNFMIW